MHLDPWYRSEVYWGVYEQGVLMSERLAKPDGVDTLSDEFIGVGTGWGAYKDAHYCVNK
jgi:tRNA threonylcarbamoyladenosine biosynthesis protein TsaB